LECSGYRVANLECGIFDIDLFRIPHSPFRIPEVLGFERVQVGLERSQHLLFAVGR